MSNLLVIASGEAIWQGRRMRCALGKAGICDATAKREGDGATPAGRWLMRELLYRADRGQEPVTGLPVRMIAPDDGWCDAPDDPRYNQPVQHPYVASAERLWRTDHVYNLIVPLGYNDAPVIAGRGSAIFLHLARENYAPTEGCVALALPDILFVLATATEKSAVVVQF